MTDQCSHCRGVFHDVTIVGIELSPKDRLCPGCYYCWRHGPPIIDPPAQPPLSSASLRAFEAFKAAVLPHFTGACA